MRALRWEALADGIADAMVLIFMENIRTADKQEDAWRQRQQAKIAAGLQAIDEAVSPGPHGVGRSSTAQFLLENTLSLADLAVVAGVGYVGLRGPQLLQGKYPNLHAWLAWMQQRPSVAETAPPKS